jgi:DNA-binding NarL/FixJ family response regulator
VECYALAGPEWQKRTRDVIGKAILEEDESIRKSLVRWINHQAEYSCVGAFGSLKAAEAGKNPGDHDLVLFDGNLTGWPGAQARSTLFSFAPGVPAFPFGVYKESDDIFITLSGVSGGYFFRRRPPLDLLEPIRRAWGHGAPSAHTLDLQIRDYFRNLLGHRPAEIDAHDLPSLTRRELEILRWLSKGHPDKQIAQALRISSWTVHNHVKKIFTKLGVHTRTEAVIRFLQK